ncbi:hypothetical protein BJY52DRAFT_497774 [Lactarius psammicola]|nr:hypothetical protein BJY52DRAFT_497774 [Lactarius psammicola]
MSMTRPPYDVPAVSFDAPPRLTSWQRSRLVRSTRKLAKILGETPVPQIALPSPEPLPTRNKSRGIIQECPRSPIVSLTKKLARTAFEPIQVALGRDPDSDGEGARSTNSEPACVGKSLRRRDRSPVLFFEAPNPAPVDPRACHISQVSSNGPSSFGPSFRRRRSSLASISSSDLILSHVEWEECGEEREARRRRKRLSKLTRYLGESIPPDLILPNVTHLKPKINANTSIFTTNPPTVHGVVPPMEQGTLLPSTILPSPISKSPKPAVVRTMVGSIGRSLSHRFNAGVTSPRLLARRLRRSRSESTLSLSHEYLTLLCPDTYSAADDHPDTPSLEEIGSMVPPPRSGAVPWSPPPAAGHFP